MSDVAGRNRAGIGEERGSMTATASIHRAARSREMKWLAHLGPAARATSYLLIGWLALLLAGKPRGEADQRGALQEVARQRRHCPAVGYRDRTRRICPVALQRSRVRGGRSGRQAGPACPVVGTRLHLRAVRDQCVHLRSDRAPAAPGEPAAGVDGASVVASWRPLGGGHPCRGDLAANLT
jgi:hypothetical protein